MFALATAGLTSARKALLEDQLKNLLRSEIVATGSFAQADMARAAGRVLFYLRVGLESFGPSVEDATRALETRHLNEISAIGARVAEEYRQRSLGLSGLRDWLDGRQRQFLDALKQPEAGLHPQTREPVLWLAGQAQAGPCGVAPDAAGRGHGPPERHRRLGRAGPRRLRHPGAGPRHLHHRQDAHLGRGPAPHRGRPRPLPPLGAGTGAPRRGLRRLPPPLRHGHANGVDAVRQIVLDALDATPDDAWKPHDAKARARALLLRAVRELETMPLPHPPSHGSNETKNGGRRDRPSDQRKRPSPKVYNQWETHRAWKTARPSSEHDSRETLAR